MSDLFPKRKAVTKDGVPVKGPGAKDENGARPGSDYVAAGRKLRNRNTDPRPMTTGAGKQTLGA